MATGSLLLNPAVLRTPMFMRDGRGRTNHVDGCDGSSGGAPGTGIGEAGEPAPTPAVVLFQERGRKDAPNLESQEDVAYALTAPNGGGRRQEKQIAGGFGVRRLTPLECCRLQGFPDDWLDLEIPVRPISKGHAFNQDALDAQQIAAKLSDSAKYRLLGNAVCANVAEWIGRRLMATLENANAGLTNRQKMGKT